MSTINVHLQYEPVGARPLLGERANPNLAPVQQAVRALNLEPQHNDKLISLASCRLRAT